MCRQAASNRVLISCSVYAFILLLVLRAPLPPLMHLRMPLQLIAPPERLVAPGLGADVAALGSVRADVLREVRRLGEGGGTAGMRADEGAVAGVGACEAKCQRAAPPSQFQPSRKL